MQQCAHVKCFDTEQCLDAVSCVTPHMASLGPYEATRKNKGNQMSSDFGNFLMFLAALALQRWKPQATAARALRVLVWSALAFVSGLALLFSLLTLWWPPAHLWAVIWSGAALATLTFTAISHSAASE